MYGISPSNVAFPEGAGGCDFLRKSQLGSRGFETHPKEKCSNGAGMRALRRRRGKPMTPELKVFFAPTP
jgi:hypothetical protein